MAFRRELAAAGGLSYPQEEPEPWIEIYPDGRELLNQAHPKGREEYWERTKQMAVRQGWRCGCGCGHKMSFRDFGEGVGFESDMTFDHGNLRGKFRDDRIVLPDGSWVNAALRYGCNGRKGSRRIPYAPHARNV
jgi:hypothetical protein